MKYFYLSLPITSLWVFYPLAYNILPSSPTETWWAVPVAVTMWFIYIIVSVFGVIEHNKY